MGGDVTNICKLTASLRKETNEKKMNVMYLLRAKQQHQHSSTGCSSLGVTGGSTTDTKEEEVVFQAAVEHLMEDVIDGAKQIDRFEKELASTLDGEYWAVVEGRMSHKRRK